MMEKETAEQRKNPVSLFKRFFFPVDKQNKEEFREQVRDVNVRRMFFFSIYIILLQIGLNVINIFKPSDGQSGDIMHYVILSMATLGVGVVYFVLFLLVRKKKLRGQGTIAVLIQSLIYIYIIIQLVFCTFNILGGQELYSFIIAILMLGLVPIIPPIQSMLTIIAAFGYTLVTMYVTRGVSGTWEHVLATDTWANLIIITGITVCISVFSYDMYASNFLQKLDLKERNGDLKLLNNALAGMNKQLEHAANVDHTTGLMNRHSFTRNFKNTWLVYSLKQARLAIVLLDIDFFKSYNDTYGHQQGDECLKMIAQSLNNSFRRSDDIVGRYGGEEFIVVFDPGNKDAFDVVERARRNVEDLKITHANQSVSPYVTISAGICIVTASERADKEKAIKIADDALYESKHNGRNRTTLKKYEDIEPVIGPE